MKFSEKLIALRKSNGMSQEELGEKLGVTRQTISKWELEQTAPDMNSLNKISELFDVSVDYLANDNRGENQEQEKTVNTGSPVVDDEKRKKILIIVSIVLGIIIMFYMVGFFVVGKILNFGANIGKDLINAGVDMIDQIQDGIKDNQSAIYNEITGITNPVNEDTDEKENKLKPKAFNTGIEMYKGTSYGIFAKSAIDEFVSSNEKNKDQQIKLTINDVEYVDSDKMVEAKKGLDNMSQYEITFKYDNNGYICEAIIK